MQVFGDVPTVIKIEALKEGGKTIFEIEIRHSSPSSSHYVDVIEVEVNERLDRVTDLEPQTSTTFMYKHDIGSVQYGNIRVRVHCNIHGWSGWESLDGEPEKPFFETPLGVVTMAGVIGVIVIVLLIVMRRK